MQKPKGISLTLKWILCNVHFTTSFFLINPASYDNKTAHLGNQCKYVEWNVAHTHTHSECALFRNKPIMGTGSSKISLPLPPDRPPVVSHYVADPHYPYLGPLTCSLPPYNINYTFSMPLAWAPSECSLPPLYTLSMLHDDPPKLGPLKIQPPPPHIHSVCCVMTPLSWASSKHSLPPYTFSILHDDPPKLGPLKTQPPPPI